jgi:hypothetical protein
VFDRFSAGCQRQHAEYLGGAKDVARAFLKASNPEDEFFALTVSSSRRMCPFHDQYRSVGT